MIRETPDRSGHHFYGDMTKVFSGNEAAEERDVNDICLQTGEEFSTEFLRDRIALRRVADQNQLPQGMSTYNDKQMVYEDLSSIHEIHRKDSEYNALGYVPRTGYAAKVENRLYSDRISRCQWEYSPSGQHPGKYVGELNSVRVNMGSTTPHKYVVESPLSYHPYGTAIWESAFSGKMKFLCSFCGRILPRPSDGKLRYVGGETRIISIRKNVTWEELAKKTLAICNQPHTIKYQLPGEDLDALISVCSNEDLHHMIEEYQEIERNGGSQRLRIFLISSTEPDTPNSFEGMTPQQSECDCQYVFAVNGMPDLSSQRSSSGQNLASLPMQMGNISDHGPTFHLDSPTPIFALDNDCSPNISNVMGTLPNPAVQFVTKLQISGKSFNQSPPLSPGPIRHKDQKNSSIQFYIDPSCTESNESTNNFALDKIPFDNSYHPQASMYYNKISQRPLTLMNYHQHHQYLTEINKPSEMHFHNRSPSGDFISHPLHLQSDINSGKRRLKERALSDSRLQEHDEGSKYYEEVVNTLFMWNYGREKSPSLAMSSSSQEPIMWEGLTGEKHQNECSFDTMKNTYMDQVLLKRVDGTTNCSAESRQCVGNISSDNSMEYKGLQNSDNLPSIHHREQDSQVSGRMVCTTGVNAFENSVDNMREHPLSCQSGKARPAPDIFFMNQNAAIDQQCTIAESCQHNPDVYPGYHHPPSEGVQSSVSPALSLANFC